MLIEETLAASPHQDSAKSFLYIAVKMSSNMLCCDDVYLVCPVILLLPNTKYGLLLELFLYGKLWRTSQCLVLTLHWSAIL